MAKKFYCPARYAPGLLKELSIIRGEFVAWMERSGYPVLTVRLYQLSLERVAVWLSRRGRKISAIAGQDVPVVLRDFFLRLLACRTKTRHRAALHAWLRFRKLPRLFSDATRSAPWRFWVEEYDHFLVNDNGLSANTRIYRRRYAKLFLGASFGRDPACWEQVTPQDIWRFSERFAARVKPSSANIMLGSLRSLFRYAHLRGLCGPELAKAVPQVANYGRTQAPRVLSEQQNDAGERADAFLYCVEVKPEGSDIFIPLAPSWLVGEKSKVACRWQRVSGSVQLQPEIASVSAAEVAAYKAGKDATVGSSRVIDPFHPERTWSVESLRGPDGLRLWTNDDLVPRAGDVFQERLYCIRCMNTVIRPDGTVEETRRYAAPAADDLRREARSLELLRDRFADWQRQGFIPSKRIPEVGAETDRLFRERGWTHWHHLFTPRQLLTHGLLAEISGRLAQSKAARVGCLLGLGKLANMDSKLCVWHVSPANENGEQVFLNQALNTLSNYSNRPLMMLPRAWATPEYAELPRSVSSFVANSDARDLRKTCDIWLTDPPYADAVNYHELGDFFLAWYDKQLAIIFPEWTPDARSELAVRGDGDAFRHAMVDIYKNLARHMPDEGLQMVQFTHQDPAVWADLGMILWAAGLKATAAWTISTETDAVGIKKGNYVQGTVCLVLRKRTAGEAGFLDEIFPLVEDEVHRQIDSMRDLDEGGEPNFNDADYQLAAYSAALKVLTHYATIDGREVEHEVFAVRERGRKSDFEAVIERALGIACDYLVPRGLDAVWRDLSLAERYYLRALEIESRGERRKGMYEELARGFGVTDIKPLLKADKANGVTLLTPSGFGSGLLAAPTGATPIPGALAGRRGRGAGAPHPFATSATRHLLFAIRETVAADNSPEPGRQYLRDTYGPGIYWQHRERFIALLEWLAILSNAAGMGTWAADSSAARLLAGRLRNDQA